MSYVGINVGAITIKAVALANAAARASDSGPLVEMAVREMHVRRDAADAAWTAAVEAQIDAEAAARALGKRALDKALADGRPAILLAGHGYNAFSSEASQSVAKKLSSMGIIVIPADCLRPAGEGPAPWHFANQILNAVSVAKEHPNLFLLCVSNFSCAIDAFTHSMVASEMGSKPFLILEIDAHTADAGVQTRLYMVRGGAPCVMDSYYESYGHAVSPSVLRQVDVHIQQVLEHASGKHEAA